MAKLKVPQITKDVLAKSGFAGLLKAGGSGQAIEAWGKTHGISRAEAEVLAGQVAQGMPLAQIQYQHRLNKNLTAKQIASLTGDIQAVAPGTLKPNLAAATQYGVSHRMYLPGLTDQFAKPIAAKPRTPRPVAMPVGKQASRITTAKPRTPRPVAMPVVKPLFPKPVRRKL